MAKGRFLSTTIATDRRLNSVSIDAEYLFLKCIPHLDRDGLILFGDGPELWAHIAPRRPELLPTIAGLTQELIDVGLVTRYATGEGDVLCFPGFAKNQTGMRYDREGPSRFAAPPGYVRTKAGLIPDESRMNSGLTPDELRTNSPLSLSVSTSVSVRGSAPSLESVTPESATPPQTHTPTTVGEKPPYAFIDRTDDQKAILRLYQDTTAQVITSSEKRVAWLDDMTKSAGRARMESLMADLRIEIQAGRVLPYNALQWLSDSLRPVQGRNGKRPTPPPNISDMPDFGVTAT